MKHLIRNILILVAVLACLSVFFIPGQRLDSNEEIPMLAIPEPVQETVVEPEEPLASMPPAFPVLLAIESIGVQAGVTSVGILGKAMAVPASNTDVGWYEMGVRPGDEGTAVLAGHVNWYGGKDAVFTKLHLMEVGDVIAVTDSNGSTVQFVVRDKKSYPLNADTSEVFRSSDGRAHLNLITCDGPWSVVMGTHESRLVVFADKIDDEDFLQTETIEEDVAAIAVNQN